MPVRELSLLDLRRYRVDRNPDPLRFPNQDARITPAAGAFAGTRGFEAYAIPALEDLFAFTEAYVREIGSRAGKTAEQRSRAARVRFDLELKRIPFFPETIGDGFDGRRPGELERQVVRVVRSAGVAARTTVRSFDHRSVACLLELEPALTGAVLLAETAPADPAALARPVGAGMICPAYQFLDADLVRRARQGGVRIVPWTVNDPDHWHRLLGWGVDGLTTDFPDRLAADLRGRGVEF